MEHISDILKKQTRTNSSKENTEIPSEDESAPEEICPICKGFKFVHPMLSPGVPDYSKVIPCTCVSQELDKERKSRLQKYSNLGLMLTQSTFDNFNPEGKNSESKNKKKIALILEKAKIFADKPEGWIVITGPSGCGKTHLAAAITNRCITNEISAFYVTAPELMDHLRNSFNPNSEMPYDEFFDKVKQSSVLIIDDFGVQSSTPWVKEKLDQLFNHRYSNRLPTVIVSIADIDELDDRVKSRIKDGDFCQVFSIECQANDSYYYEWAPWFELQKDMTFEKFDSKRVNLSLEQRQNLETAYDLAVEFAKDPDGWLVFAGVNGCGKTHLAAAIKNYRNKSGNPALFTVVPDFLDHLRSTFSPDSKISYDQYFESVKNVELLILDDFGEQTGTPWAQEKLYQVINHRYNARLATVITTSCSPDEIENRISSRLVDPKISTFFNIMAPDYRGDRKTKKRVYRSQTR